MLAPSVLTGANTYSGGTNLNGGVLAVNNDGNLGTGPLNFNGGTLEALEPEAVESLQAKRSRFLATAAHF